MTAERFVFSITLISVGFVVFALAIVGGSGLPLSRWAASFNLPAPDLGGISLSLPAISFPTPTLPASVRTYDGLLVLTGMICGWALRWLYHLPWGSLPQLLLAGLLGWRNSMVMLSLVVVCTVILVFY